MMLYTDIKIIGHCDIICVCGFCYAGHIAASKHSIGAFPYQMRTNQPTKLRQPLFLHRSTAMNKCHSSTALTDSTLTCLHPFQTTQ